MMQLNSLKIKQRIKKLCSETDANIYAVICLPKGAKI